MLRVNRASLVKKLEMCRPGVASKGVIDQSDCFVFCGDAGDPHGEVVTYNGEVACRVGDALPGVRGAVRAGPLLDQLGKWGEEEVEVEVRGEKLWVYGSRRKAWFNLEAEVRLPVDGVDRPGEWRDLPPNFPSAVDSAASCAGKDNSKFQLTCVHLHPEWVEASDDVQITRFVVSVPGLEKTLVRATSVRDLAGLGVSQWSQTKDWMHFRNVAGLTYSCVRFLEEYPDATPFLAVEGVPTQLPKNLGDSLANAEVFTRENSESNVVRISLLPNKLLVEGMGNSGGYSEVKDVTFAGQQMSFTISPRMLREILDKHPEVLVSTDKLVVNGPGFVYRTGIDPAPEV